MATKRGQRKSEEKEEKWMKSGKKKHTRCGGFMHVCAVLRTFGKLIARICDVRTNQIKTEALSWHLLFFPIFFVNAFILLRSVAPVLYLLKRGNQLLLFFLLLNVKQKVRRTCRRMIVNTRSFTCGIRMKKTIFSGSLSVLNEKRQPAGNAHWMQVKRRR